MPEWFFYNALLSLVLFAVALWLLRSGRLLVQSPTEKSMDELRQKVDWLTAERNQLLSDLVSAKREIERLTRNEQKLQRELSEVRVQIEQYNRPRLRVLGIWPNSNLDTQGERLAIDGAGFDYIPLIGDLATREHILRELRLDGFTVVEIGAHGDREGIHVADNDVLDAGFWIGALNRRTVRVALLLACHSDLSIADAFRRAGVQHVIAATTEIEDEDAVRFARAFYQAYADGLDINRAFGEARLVLDRREREKLVLR